MSRLLHSSCVLDVPVHPHCLTLFSLPLTQDPVYTRQNGISCNRLKGNQARRLSKIRDGIRSRCLVGTDKARHILIRTVARGADQAHVSGHVSLRHVLVRIGCHSTPQAQPESGQDVGGLLSHLRGVDVGHLDTVCPRAMQPRAPTRRILLRIHRVRSLLAGTTYQKVSRFELFQRFEGGAAGECLLGQEDSRFGSPVRTQGLYQCGSHHWLCLDPTS